MNPIVIPDRGLQEFTPVYIYICRHPENHGYIQSPFYSIHPKEGREV